jgi:signal transduction histidine kinase
VAHSKASYLGSVALVVGVVVAIGAGAVFAQADQVDRMGANAQDLATIERIRAETATHRASLVVSFAAAGSTDGQAEVAVTAARDAMAAAGRIVDLLGGLEEPQPDLVGLGEALLETTTKVVGLVEAGNLSVARGVVETETISAVESLVGALQSEASRLTSRIEGERSDAGRLARVASFIVALVLPAIMVAGYRRSARRRIERERLEAELVRQRDVSDAKDQLIAGISHQLRTPITGIYGYADLMLRGSHPDLVGEGLDAILSQSGDLRRMVDDILVTARIDTSTVSYQATPMQIVDVVDRVVAHHHQLGAVVKVEVEPARFATDGSRLEQALRNLVANAVVHGREPVSVLGRKQGDHYQIAVCDTGPGLTPEQALEPFAAFAHAPADITTANSLGLGLSVARTLVNGIGGAISYAHSQDMTVFAISLPINPVAGELDSEGTA